MPISNTFGYVKDLEGPVNAWYGGRCNGGTMSFRLNESNGSQSVATFINKINYGESMFKRRNGDGGDNSGSNS